MIDVSKIWTGDDIKAFLEERNLTQRELAQILGVRSATISDWVRGAVVPSRLASIALTYIAHDMEGELILRKKRR